MGKDARKYPKDWNIKIDIIGKEKFFFAMSYQKFIGTEPVIKATNSLDQAKKLIALIPENVVIGQFCLEWTTPSDKQEGINVMPVQALKELIKKFQTGEKVIVSIGKGLER